MTTTVAPTAPPATAQPRPEVILSTQGLTKRFGARLAVDGLSLEVRRGDVMPDGPAQGCHICFYRDLGYAFDRANQRDSAIVMFERFVRMPSAFSLGTHAGELHIVLRRLGELYESKAARTADGRAARADRMRAIQYYSQFVNLWKNADAELQPQVSDVRRRIARLSAD